MDSIFRSLVDVMVTLNKDLTGMCIVVNTMGWS